MTAVKLWTGINEADAIATFNDLCVDTDTSARYYYDADIGKWVVEGSAVKSTIPGVIVIDAEGKKQPVITKEAYDRIQGV